MSFLKNLFKRNKPINSKLLKLQNVVTNNDSDVLVMSESQINSAANLYVTQMDRILKDNCNLINNTCTTDVFFSRFELTVNILKTLISIEDCISLSPLPSEELNKLYEHKDILIIQFVDRALEKTLNSASSLKTKKGKENRIKKFFESLLKYSSTFSKDVTNHINELGNTYNFYNELNSYSEPLEAWINESANDIDKAIEELKAWTKGEPNPTLDECYEKNRENFSENK